jgi:hypothetical protein
MAALWPIEVLLPVVIHVHNEETEEYYARADANKELG